MTTTKKTSKKTGTRSKPKADLNSPGWGIDQKKYDEARRPAKKDQAPKPEPKSVEPRKGPEIKPDSQ